MPHVFFGLTMAGVFALCAFGVLPSGEFVDIGKWVTILYAISTTMVAIVRHVWPRPTSQFENLAVTEAPRFTGAVEGPWITPDTEMGVGLPLGFGSLHDDVFSEPIGHGVPRNYTSMVRDRDAPPVTTDAADGSSVLVPSVTAPLDIVEPEVPLEYLGQVPLEYLGLLGAPVANRKPPADMAARLEASKNVVVLGDPPKKEDPT